MTLWCSDINITASSLALSSWIYCRADKYMDPTNLYKEKVWHKLSKDNKDKRVNLKCQLFLFGELYKRRVFVGLLMDQVCSLKD